MKAKVSLREGLFPTVYSVFDAEGKFVDTVHVSDIKQHDGIIPALLAKADWCFRNEFNRKGTHILSAIRIA